MSRLFLPLVYEVFETAIWRQKWLAEMSPRARWYYNRHWARYNKRHFPDGLPKSSLEEACEAMGVILAAAGCNAKE